jgi:hypothetical protein
MAHRIEHDHVVLHQRPMSRGARIAFWSCVGGAIGIVMFGWLWTVKGVIGAGVSDAKATFQTAGSAVTEVRESNNAAKQELSDTGKQIQNELMPYISAAVEHKQAIDAVTEIMAKNLQEPYAQEEPATESEPATE